jgi:antitoxin component YwqK of YwqJK toxin-antitoxin module
MTAQVNQYDSEGRRHGVWEGYWANGTLWQKEHWLHGNLHGLRERYQPDGTPKWKDYYLTIK